MTSIITIPNLLNTLVSTKQLCINFNNVLETFFAMFHRFIILLQQFYFCFLEKKIENFFTNLTFTTQMLLTVTICYSLKYQLETTAVLTVIKKCCGEDFNFFSAASRRNETFYRFLFSTNAVNTISKIRRSKTIRIKNFLAADILNRSFIKRDL